VYLCAFKVDDNAASDGNMATSNLAQFWLLLWKNWLLQKRSIVLTAAQIITPAFFAIILLLLRMRVAPEFVSQPTIWDSFEVSTSGLPPNLTHVRFRSRNYDRNITWILAFSPSTSLAARKIATETAKTLEMTPYGISLSSYVSSRLVYTVCPKTCH